MPDARYFTAFGIPILLILITALTKKIVRKTVFQWEYFYLGVDLTLAAFATAAVNVADLIQQDRSPNGTLKPEIGLTATIYIIACFFLFVLQVAFHQDWSDRPGSKKWKQVIVLGITSNVVGVALLGFFIFLKMKGKI